MISTDDFLDVDECKNNAGMVLGMCKHGRCVNTMGDFYCACSSGYRSAKDRKTCNGKISAPVCRTMQVMFYK